MKNNMQISNIRKSRFSVLFFIVVLNVSILLILCGFLFAKTNMYAPIPKTNKVTGTVSQIDENTREFVFDLDDKQGDCLMFYCNHSYIHAYSGERLLYSLEDGGTIFGRTPGGNYQFINLHGISGEVVLDIEAVYPQLRDKSLTFYQGDFAVVYS